MCILDDGEVFAFAISIFGALQNAGWDPSPPFAIPPNIYNGPDPAPPDSLKMLPAAARAGGNPWGISIVARCTPERGGQMWGAEPMDSLAKAFLNAGFGIHYTTDGAMANDVIRIVVGSKS